MKAHKPAPDPDLDRALAEIRTRVRRRGHGRVFAELNVDESMVIGRAFSEDPMTWEDVQRELTKMPRTKEDR